MKKRLRSIYQFDIIFTWY